jgi:NAD(P)-dependent dehydrogenase (short-subunit alcohol dehydrogenase family)
VASLDGRALPGPRAVSGDLSYSRRALAAAFDLTGKRAVVTGASTGIGAAISLALAEAGADVAGVALEEADETAAAVRAAGRRALMLVGDTGDPVTSERVAEAAVEQLGGIDIWVNNAARLQVKPFVETSDNDWHDLLAANLHGYFYGCRAAARRMLDQGAGGRIVNVTSATTTLAVSGLAAYTAAKGAVLALTKVLAVELAPAGITVNALSPGATDTAMNATAYTPEVRRTYEQRIPLGRIAAAEEIAGAAVFLASGAARYVTGEELVVDGGLTITGEVGHARDPSDA